MRQFVSGSARETRNIARDFARLWSPLLPAGLVVCLQGGLGAGKTCFAHAFFAELGLREGAGSPSFPIILEYSATLRHMDFYRLDGADEIEQIGAFEYFDLPGCTVIEWPERAGALVKERAQGRLAWLRIEASRDSLRNIIVEVEPG